MSTDPPGHLRIFNYGAIAPTPPSRQPAVIAVVAMIAWSIDKSETKIIPAPTKQAYNRPGSGMVDHRNLARSPAWRRCWTRDRAFYVSLIEMPDKLSISPTRPGIWRKTPRSIVAARESLRRGRRV